MNESGNSAVPHAIIRTGKPQDTKWDDPFSLSDGKINDSSLFPVPFHFPIELASRELDLDIEGKLGEYTRERFDNITQATNELIKNVNHEVSENYKSYFHQKENRLDGVFISFNGEEVPVVSFLLSYNNPTYQIPYHIQNYQVNLKTSLPYAIIIESIKNLVKQFVHNYVKYRLNWLRAFQQKNVYLNKIPRNKTVSSRVRVLLWGLRIDQDGLYIPKSEHPISTPFFEYNGLPEEEKQFERAIIHLMGYCKVGVCAPDENERDLFGIQDSNTYGSSSFYVPGETTLNIETIFYITPTDNNLLQAVPNEILGRANYQFHTKRKEIISARRPESAKRIKTANATTSTEIKQLFVGGGRRFQPLKESATRLVEHKSYYFRLNIDEDKNMCLAESIAILEADENSSLRRNSCSKTQRFLAAKDIIKRYNLIYSHRNGIDIIDTGKKLAKKGITFIVYNAEKMHTYDACEFKFVSKRKNAMKMFLLRWGSHVYPIRDIKRFWGFKLANQKKNAKAPRFCNLCFLPFYNLPHLHNARMHPGLCKYCLCEHDVPKQNVRLPHCAACCRTFFNENCFRRHTELGICDSSFYCSLCDKDIYKNNSESLDANKKLHKCGFFNCFRCKQCLPCKQKFSHRCIIPKKPEESPMESRKKPDTIRIVFDFETRVPDNQTNYEVDLAVARYMEPSVVDQESYIFEKKEALDLFCKWLLQPKHANAVALAHNGGAFDFHFIWRWCVTNGIKCDTVYRGAKMVTMKIPIQSDRGKMAFVYLKDSMLFVPGPLAKYPKTFGFPDIRKTFFPYKFNKEENWNYIGDLPSDEYFEVSRMDANTLSEFEKWKVEKKKQPWNFWQEYVEYCQQDVEILQKAALAMNNLMWESMKIDVFKQSTIASTCMAIFRYNFQPDIGYSIPMLDYFSSEWIRKGFFGGRTESYKPLYKFQPGEIGLYYDVVSEYPATMFYDEYPVGTPLFMKDVPQNFQWRDYLGFALCDVTPPIWLYHPYLPYRGKTKKLFFPLVSIKDGIYSTTELFDAEQLGYKVTVKSILYWTSKSRDLFKNYVRAAMQMKIHASGWSEDCNTDAKKQAFVDLYKQEYDIIVDPNKMKHNPGVRELSKLILNSLWGKFGQQIHRTISELVSNIQECSKILCNPQNLITDVHELVELKKNEPSMMEIRYKRQNEQEGINMPKNINLGIAAYTTVNARRRIYKQLNHLQEQVLYCDTDSVMFIYNPNDPSKNKLPIDCGDMLGQWKSEFPSGVHMIDFFAGCGPKNYAFKTSDGKSVVKIKGISMNPQNKVKFNYEKIIEFAKSFALPAIERPVEESAASFSIKRNRLNKALQPSELVKKYSCTFSKRKIVVKDKDSFIDSFPWGSSQDDILPEGNECNPFFPREEEEEDLLARLIDVL